MRFLTCEQTDRKNIHKDVHTDMLITTFRTAIGTK